jgi:hypothetical protein
VIVHVTVIVHADELVLVLVHVLALEYISE